MRRIFIGDVQGCRRQLDDLLSKLKLRSGDRLYLAGDMVNRGPDSLGVLRRARELDMRVVLGNHDIHLLRRAAGTAKRRPRDTLEDVLDAPDAVALLAWLEARPVILVESDVVMVHGGIHPHWTDIEAVADIANAAVRQHVRGHPVPEIEFATQVRHCDAAGRRPTRDDPPPPAPFRPWDAFYRGERLVVFAHWAARGLVIGARVRGLDTGCVWGRKLTAWIAEDERIVQVPGPRR